MTTNLETEAGKVGLRISANKTKVMQIVEVEVLQPITVGGKNVDDVGRFIYLGSIYLFMIMLVLSAAAQCAYWHGKNR